ncbi:unnamed protein product, partial [Ixodes persulcatus]
LNLPQNLLSLCPFFHSSWQLLAIQLATLPGVSFRHPKLVPQMHNSISGPDLYGHALHYFSFLRSGNVPINSSAYNDILCGARQTEPDTILSVVEYYCTCSDHLWSSTNTFGML